jgi:hypothetical protein
MESTFSETRFCEYRYRWMRVFIFMHQPLYLLYQKRASEDSNEAIDYQQSILDLQDPEQCLKLCFMYEVSQIVTRTEKHCQDQNYLPPDRKQKMELLMSQLRSAQSSFASNQIPETIDVTAPEQSIGKWQAWIKKWD